ncbi:MAG: hypothetical protein ACLTK0_04585 [Anaerovoracaceae bacterium]
MPLYSQGMSRGKAFLYGSLSVCRAGRSNAHHTGRRLRRRCCRICSALAGAMIYVVVEELIPEMSEGEHSHAGTLFAVGFVLMMILDVALG